MTYTIHGFHITGRIVGRSAWVDRNGRRKYLLLCCDTGNLFEVSGDLLREAQFSMSDAQYEGALEQFYRD